MIRDLEIKNYRLFEQFKVSSLAGVNLIVGNNNSGKSTLLEAIHLLASDDTRSSLIFILNDRGEIASGYIDQRYDRGRSGGYQISQIFHDRHIKPGQTASIVSYTEKYMPLHIILRESESLSNKSGDSGQQSLFDDEIGIGYADLMVFERNDKGTDTPKERVRLTEDGILLETRFNTRRVIIQSTKGKSRFLTSNYMGYDELAVLWDKITLTPKEEKVIEALKILEPTVDRISFTSSQTANSGILLRMVDQYDPIPLGSMGDGMRRIMAIAASLVSVEGGTLLVDEIDTGLYHGTLADMWRLVLETASKQNAQVFATTHSWDCVKAFQQALEGFQNPDIGKLIRLEKTIAKVKAVLYSADELDIAIEQGIEVR